MFLVVVVYSLAYIDPPIQAPEGEATPVRRANWSDAQSEAAREEGGTDGQENSAAAPARRQSL